MNPWVAVVAVFFAGMGLLALVRPPLMWVFFDVVPSTPGSRSEVRAVYGGFGVAIAALLFVADGWSGGMRDGVLLTVAVALFGMSAGRAASGLIEPKALIGYPGFFMVMEAALAGLLLAAR
jgi:hypothetical protein